MHLLTVEVKLRCSRKEVLHIARNSFIQMSKLTNLKGRIDYISSHARQENLYAVYETVERKFWRELAKCNQEEYVKSGTDGKCIEARELIIALPESFVDYDPKVLLKLFTEHFKQHYEAECIAALHHNKRKTNYHIHLIFSERKLLEEPVGKIATRNMFYNEAGKHVRTKKEILDENGQIRSGCKVIAKGEVYERKLFTIKNAKFKSEAFLDEVKQSYTDLINLYVHDDKQKFKVFDRSGVYLPMKKIGKNNPKEDQIVAANQMRTKWNLTVDNALVSGVSEADIKAIKRTQISQPAKQSIQKYGRNPERFGQLIQLAIGALEMFIRRLLDMVATKAEETNRVVEKEIKTHVPERPKQSELASKYPRLKEIHAKLLNQSTAINRKKKEVGELKEELAETKGVFKFKQRKILQEKVDKAEIQLSNMEQQMPMIAKQYHYSSVKSFMAEFNASKAEHEDYQRAMKSYKKATSKEVNTEEGVEFKRESVMARLQQKKKEIKEREAGKQRTRSKPKDRGAR